MFRVNDIFYSLQGEGCNTGRAALFVRFAGCNLSCPFCDTDFRSYREMSGPQIVDELWLLCGRNDKSPLPFVVLTGGEPSLQVDEAFVDLLHYEGFRVAMESNGTHLVPGNLDWLTVSPKAGSFTKMCNANTVPSAIPDEIKIVYDGENDPEEILSEYLQSSFLVRPDLKSDRKESILCLQPCDTGDAARNKKITAACVDYVKSHPQWRLSLQTHKLIGIE